MGSFYKLLPEYSYNIQQIENHNYLFPVSYNAKARYKEDIK